MTAVDLDELCAVTVRLAEIGATPPVIADADLAELPDLGSSFNDALRWQALAAEVEVQPPFCLLQMSPREV